MKIRIQEEDFLVVALDLTGSMNTGDADGRTRLEAAKAVIYGIAASRARSFTVITFGLVVGTLRDVTADNVREKIGRLVADQSETLTHGATEAAIAEYAAHGRNEDAFRLIVLTDGVPSSSEAFERTLAGGRDAISFVAVGRDPELAAYVQRASFGAANLADVVFVHAEHLNAESVGSLSEAFGETIHAPANEPAARDTRPDSIPAVPATPARVTSPARPSSRSKRGK